MSSCACFSFSSCVCFYSLNNFLRESLISDLVGSVLRTLPTRSEIRLSLNKLICFFQTFVEQTDEELQLLYRVFGVAFVPFIAIRGELLKPFANIIFRDIVPLGISLQA